MEFPLTEPTNPRYLYVAPETNEIYVLATVIGGNRYGSDNTCKSVFSFQEFFGKSRDVHQKAVLDELRDYKKALEFDIGLLDEASKIKQEKQERLNQINQYIEAIEAVLKSKALDSLSLALPEYPAALQEIMKKPDTNLHSMVLRPKTMDSYLRFINPVFSLKRGIEGDANESVFYKTLSTAYKGVTSLSAEKAKLYKKVLASTAAINTDFVGIRFVLSRYVKHQLGVNVDFRRDEKGAPVTKASIETLLGVTPDTPATAKEYVEALLGACAPQLFDTVVKESPFYTRSNGEELSIITQFFMATLNIYCRSNGLSTLNFGAELDKSQELSEDIAARVLSIDNGDSIEDALLDYINNKDAFGLTRALTPIDRAHIKKQFTEHYSAIKKSPHFDEFTCLDDSKNGPFISHQGSICIDFAQFVRQALPGHAPEHFERIHADFKALNKETIRPTNPSVHATIELTIDALLAKITDEDQLQAVLKKLPQEQRDEILASPQIKRMQVPKFLLHVARRQQKTADTLLKDNPDAQLLLQTPGKFTDYSGRTFSNCTAYEYAYWAKDTHMQRMLEKHMDEETKARMLERVDAIEANGLTYTHHGEIKNSKHFDFTPVKTALQEYVNGYEAWYAARNWVAMKAAWMKLGKAQRDFPVHVANEYCRKDRSFDPLPAFNEASLPEELTFYNFETDRYEAWFPLVDSPTSGFGVDFAVCCAGRVAG